MRKITRGIITSNTNNIYLDGKTVARKLTKNDLMFYSLYWDKIVIPQGNFIMSPIPEEESYIKEGSLVYHRPINARVSINTSKIDSYYLELFYKTFDFLKNERNDTDWTLYHNIENAFQPNANIVELNALRVRLNSVLPVPSTFVTADKVIEFREKNRDRLEALHNCIFDLYVSISNINEPDIRSIYEQQKFNQLDDAIKDYQSSFKSIFKNPLFMPLTSDINIKDHAIGLSQMVVEQNISIKGVFDLSKSFLKIFSTKQSIPKSVSHETRFHYIGEAIQNGIISQF